jgi:hypothetical protein
VLDSSATLAWIYSDETTNSIRRLFDAVGEEGAVVPTLWRLEIANSLTVVVSPGSVVDAPIMARGRNFACDLRHSSIRRRYSRGRSRPSASIPTAKAAAKSKGKAAITERDSQYTSAQD